MTNHDFNFEGGEYLTKMGASWFISYMYYKKIDNKHSNWRNVKTAENRISMFNKTLQYHKFWLEQIIKMDVIKLSTNIIGLSGTEVVRMASELLKIKQNTHILNN